MNDNSIKTTLKNLIDSNKIKSANINCNIKDAGIDGLYREIKPGNSISIEIELEGDDA